jgi:fatty acid desaturase
VRGSFHAGNDRTAIPDAASLREVLARFQDPLPHVATWQIVTTILPLIVLLMVLYAGLAFGWWPLLALGVPAAALTARHGDRTEADMISSHHITIPAFLSA